MRAECCSRPRGAQRTRLAAFAALVPAGALLVAIPKCPLCLAAYFGVATALVGGALDAARGAMIAVIAACVAALVVAGLRSSSRARR